MSRCPGNDPAPLPFFSELQAVGSLGLAVGVGVGVLLTGSHQLWFAQTQVLVPPSYLSGPPATPWPRSC